MEGSDDIEVTTVEGQHATGVMPIGQNRQGCVGETDLLIRVWHGVAQGARRRPSMRTVPGDTGLRMTSIEASQSVTNVENDVGSAAST